MRSCVVLNNTIPSIFSETIRISKKTTSPSSVDSDALFHRGHGSNHSKEHLSAIIKNKAKNQGANTKYNAAANAVLLSH